MTFVDKKIRIFSAWGRTNRPFWRVLATFALVLVFMTLIWAIMFALHGGVSRMAGWAIRMPWGVIAPEAAPAFPGAAAVARVLDPALAVVHFAVQLVMLSAAQASVWRSLAGNIGDDVAQVF